MPFHHFSKDHLAVLFVLFLLGTAFFIFIAPFPSKTVACAPNKTNPCVHASVDLDTGTIANSASLGVLTNSSVRVGDLIVVFITGLEARWYSGVCPCGNGVVSTVKDNNTGIKSTVFTHVLTYNGSGYNEVWTGMAAKDYASLITVTMTGTQAHNQLTVQIDVVRGAVSLYGFLTAKCGLSCPSVLSMGNFNVQQNSLEVGAFLCWGNGGCLLSPVYETNTYTYAYGFGSLCQSLCKGGQLVTQWGFSYPSYDASWNTYNTSFTYADAFVLYYTTDESPQPPPAISCPTGFVASNGICIQALGGSQSVGSMPLSGNVVYYYAALETVGVYIDNITLHVLSVGGTSTTNVWLIIALKGGDQGLPTSTHHIPVVYVTAYTLYPIATPEVLTVNPSTFIPAYTLFEFGVVTNSNNVVVDNSTVPTYYTDSNSVDPFFGYNPPPAALIQSVSHTKPTPWLTLGVYNVPVTNPPQTTTWSKTLTNTQPCDTGATCTITTTISGTNTITFSSTTSVITSTGTTTMPCDGAGVTCTVTFTVTGTNTFTQSSSASTISTSSTTTGIAGNGLNINFTYLILGLVVLVGLPLLIMGFARTELGLVFGLGVALIIVGIGNLFGPLTNLVIVLGVIIIIGMVYLFRGSPKGGAL